MSEDLREILVKNQNEWVIVSINNRIDSFNCDELMSTLDAVMRESQKNLAFDLGKVKFLSLPSIKYMSSLADSLQRFGRQVALVAPSEKLKRQIYVYAGLDNIKLYRSEQEL